MKPSRINPCQSQWTRAQPSERLPEGELEEAIANRLCRARLPECAIKRH
jgi:hypothetical protein